MGENVGLRVRTARPQAFKLPSPVTSGDRVWLAVMLPFVLWNVFAGQAAVAVTLSPGLLRHHSYEDQLQMQINRVP